MRKAYTIFCIILLFTGCTSRQAGEKFSHAVPQSSLLVIDRPAVVVFNPGDIQHHSASDSDKGSIEKILIPFHIPLIASKSENLEFVKNNGDRVRLDIKNLPSHYDVILFNAVNDPIPCILKDLRNAARECFESKPQITLKNTHEQITTHSINPALPDTTLNKYLSNIHPSSSKRNKIIRMAVSDTSTIPLSLRNLPGINWVENRIDTRSFLDVTFENDLITYANTDRYFTNGITFSLQAPWLGRAALSKLMLPYRHSSTVSYSLELVQNMYTPKDTKVTPAFIDDRPYASYLFIGYKKITSDPFRKIKLTNEFDLGYLGPHSPGAYLQTMVHESFPTNDKPQGWETQIKTDVILNYNMKAEKSLVQNPNFMVSASVSAKAGSLYSRTGLGFRLQAGKQEPYFGSSPKLNKTSSWQYYFFLEAATCYIAYDATLQGGVFSKDNIFALRSSEISRWVSNAEGGIQVRYKGTGIEIAQHYLSPEYKGGLSHKWGRISLIFQL